MRTCALIFFMFAILLSPVACKKKEQEQGKQPPAAQGPIMDTTAPPHAGIGTGQKTQFDIVVPPDVKAGWTGIKLTVEDRQLNKTQDITIRIGDEMKIPDSNLTVRLDYFFPDFKMNGTAITSASNTLRNPAAGLVIFENGKQIFPEFGKVGWLYEKFPTIHPFQHSRFGLALKEGVKK